MTQEERDAWLAERKQGIGGSDAAAILGLSPWSTAVTVWLDKTGRSNPKPETEAMRIGTELEDYVARSYERETGRSVRRFTKMVHKDCLLGNFDRLVIPEGEKVASHMGEIRTDLLLECKTSSVDWLDGVPLYYQTQVQHYMGLEPKLQHADVACLFLVHKHFEIHRVERDDEVIATMQERLREWWNAYVATDLPPPPASEDDCKALWARSNPGKTVTATREIEDAVALLRDLRRKREEAEDAEKSLEEKIKCAMGDAELLSSVDGMTLATWKTGRDKTVVDWKAVATNCGATDEIIAQSTTVKPGNRSFLVKAAKVA